MYVYDAACIHATYDGCKEYLVLPCYNPELPINMPNCCSTRIHPKLGFHSKLLQNQRTGAGPQRAGQLERYDLLSARTAQRMRQATSSAIHAAQACLCLVLGTPCYIPLPLTS